MCEVILILMAIIIPYISRNIGGQKNLPIWLQTGHSEILAEFKFSGVANLGSKCPQGIILLAELNLAI